MKSLIILFGLILYLGFSAADAQAQTQTTKVYSVNQYGVQSMFPDVEIVNTPTKTEVYKVGDYGVRDMFPTYVAPAAAPAPAPRYINTYTPSTYTTPASNYYSAPSNNLVWPTSRPVR